MICGCSHKWVIIWTSTSLMPRDILLLVYLLLSDSFCLSVCITKFYVNCYMDMIETMIWFHVAWYNRYQSFWCMCCDHLQNIRVSHMGREVAGWDVTSKKSVIFIFRIWDLADIDEKFLSCSHQLLWLQEGCGIKEVASQTSLKKRTPFALMWHCVTG